MNGDVDPLVWLEEALLRVHRRCPWVPSVFKARFFLVLR